MILVTGVAGFVGYHVAARLLAAGERVVGIDNLNSYYDPRLKRARLARLQALTKFEFAKVDIADRAAMEELFQRKWRLVIHLAAQAGVRHSIENPHAYTASNIDGFLNVLEGCRRVQVRHLVYASSSSVYGDSLGDRTDSPLSLYAATKKANELMAHCYTHLFGFPATGLRLFTVFGPWGRPDMAPFKFIRAIARGERIDVYNYGRMWRDFTYIDDTVEGIVRIARMEPEPKGCRIFNVGSGRPVSLMAFIEALERAFGRRTPKRFLPLQAGDVVSTHADVEDLRRVTGFQPSTPLEAGVERFVEWYREFYREGDYGLGTSRRDRVLRAS